MYSPENGFAQVLNEGKQKNKNPDAVNEDDFFRDFHRTVRDHVVTGSSCSFR